MWASKVYRVRERANAGSTRYERGGLTQVSTCGVSESPSVLGRSEVFTGKESAMLSKELEVDGALASTTVFAPFPSAPVFSRIIVRVLEAQKPANSTCPAKESASRRRLIRWEAPC